MKKPLDLSGMPNLDSLLDEAVRQELDVEKAKSTGEVRITAPWGKVLCNSRRKSGNQALRQLLREGQRRRGER